MKTGRKSQIEHFDTPCNRCNRTWNRTDYDGTRTYKTCPDCRAQTRERVGSFRERNAKNCVWRDCGERVSYAAVLLCDGHWELIQPEIVKRVQNEVLWRRNAYSDDPILALREAAAHMVAVEFTERIT